MDEKPALLRMPRTRLGTWSIRLVAAFVVRSGVDGNVVRAPRLQSV